MIKTRFAPSPTGDLHIGGLRTALYNYLFAKKNGGEFLLRVEDTDQARYQEGSVKKIIQALEWVGLEWDNYKSKIKNQKSKANSKFKTKFFKLPITNYQLFLQSQRLNTYQKYAQKLIDKNYAYYCFCSKQTLDKMRKEQMNRGEAAMYDGRCLKLSPEEIKEKLKKGTPHVIRMKIPDIHTGFSQVGQTNPTKVGLKIKFHDLIRGDVEFDLKTLDDQILIKSDGYPTYHLANVVDDYEMKITHVIRAEEWLPSTPKHIILYNYLNWPTPQFAHIPLVLAPDKSKLSKRHGAVSVLEFKKLGYLPEAIINYLALLGWNPGTEQEIFSLEELVKEFSLGKVHQAGAIFDINKLDWINGEYIRKMDLDKLTGLCIPYLCPSTVIPAQAGIQNITEKTGSRVKHGMTKRVHGMTKRVHGMTKNREHIKKIIALEQGRLKKLSEIGELTDYFFKQPEFEPELLRWKKSTLDDAKEKLEFLIKELEKAPEHNWTCNALEEFIKELIASHKFETGNVLWPMRVALTGRKKSPGPFEVAEVMGKEESLKRLKIAVKKIK